MVHNKGTNCAGSFNDSLQQFETRFAEHFTNERVDNDPCENPTHQSVKFKEISVDVVSKELSQPDFRNGTGIDNINARILKDVSLADCGSITCRHNKLIPQCIPTLCIQISKCYKRSVRGKPSKFYDMT